jgi:predicted transcriptional regulator
MSSEESPATPARPDLPRLEVRDPRMMRALAHPVRVALIEAIGRAENRTLTATEASELLGESPANCAFHLRTLAKYGFIEEAGGGRGRERPWRMKYRGLGLTPPWQDTETRLAVHAVASVWIDRWLARARDRVMRAVGYPPAWQEATLASEMDLYLTAPEAKSLGDAVDELIEPYRARRGDPSLRPPGSAHYEVLLFGYPLGDPGAPARDAGPAGPPGPPTRG